MTAPRTARVGPSGEGPRIAVVGGGPRGFQALERLVDHAVRGSSCPLTVDLFEPRRRPGSSPPYDRRLPACLRMNFSARHVDAWDRRREPAEADRLDLVDWLSRARHAPVAPDLYAPRRDVGRYLEGAFELLVRMAATSPVELEHHRERVIDLTPTSADRWILSLEGDGQTAPYDQVLLATGHDGGRRDGFADRWEGRIDTVRGGAATAVAARAACGKLLADREAADGPLVVVFRGFALTAIDTILLLTDPDEGPTPLVDERRYQLTGIAPTDFAPEGPLPLRILPFARSGRPLLAKPDPGRREMPDLSGAWAPWARSVDRAPDTETLVERIVGAAHAALARVTAAPPDRSTVGDVLAQHTDGGPIDTDEALAAMRRSVAVAIGDAPLDVEWALGEAWRALYPALVRRVSFGGIGTEERTAFDRLARGMERLAFGPPAATQERLLALVDSGVLDLRFLGGAALEPSSDGPVLVRGGDSAHPDLLIDAVTPAPGVDGGSDLFGPLLERGVVSTAPGTTGLLVNAAGGVLAPDGRRVPGLSVIGRATEGWVLGLDTLSRTLHPTAERWALGVLEALRARPESAV